MPQSALRRIATALVALVALGAMAVVVPLALWRLVGWPLPNALPSVAEIRAALTQSRIADSTLLKAIAIIGWIAWAQIALSILVEGAAWAGRRPAPRLRLAGPIQPAVRKLVASAALLLGSTNLPQLSAAWVTPPRLSVATAPLPAAPSARLLPVPERSSGRPDTLADASPSTAPDPLSYTVVRRDTLWGLADTHLGDPFRWRDLYELNRGKPQPDGRSLQDPNLIVVGWVLTFPPDAMGLPAPATSNSVGPPAAAVDSAPPAPGPPAPPAAVVPEPDPAQCAPNAGTSPTTAPTPATASTPNPAPSARVDKGNDRVGDEAHPDAGVTVLVGGGLLAASLVALLARLRRVQQRRRRPGSRPKTPDDRMQRIERTLRRAADLEAATLLDLSLRAFGAGVTARGIVPPTVLAVRVHDGRVELLLDAPPAQPPEGFVPLEVERGWITAPDITVDELRALAAGAAAPLPALVSVGVLDGGDLLIDVETAGTLTIDGDDERCAELVRRLATELATSIWVDHVDLLVVGTPPAGDIAGAQRVRHIPDLDVALDELRAVAQAIAAALESAECPSTLAARFSDQHDDGWIPTILICTDPIDPDVLGQLVAIAGDGGRGVGAIVRSSTAAAWHAQVDEHTLRLLPLGFAIEAALLDDETARAIDDLLTEAAVDDPLEEADEVALSIPDTPPTVSGPYVDPAFELEIKIIGPIQVEGAAATLDRRRCVELATYLALHPRGVTDERLKTVLWPDEEPATGTFNTMVSMTRGKLGRARDGTQHLPHFAASGNLYRLGPLATTDLACFEARVEHARRCEPADAIATLRSALDLVRGQPFESTRGFEWAYAEGLIASIEATIADAAHRLAQLYLEAGDHHSATWAALQGLKAAPGDEILYRDRMLACDLAGNPAGVESVMDELCEVVESLEPYDDLHPETVALYERISHRKRARSS